MSSVSETHLKLQYTTENNPPEQTQLSEQKQPLDDSINQIGQETLPSQTGQNSYNWKKIVMAPITVLQSGIDFLTISSKASTTEDSQDQEHETQGGSGKILSLMKRKKLSTDDRRILFETFDETIKNAPKELEKIINNFSTESPIASDLTIKILEALSDDSIFDKQDIDTYLLSLNCLTSISAKILPLSKFNQDEEILNQIKKFPVSNIPRDSAKAIAQDKQFKKLARLLIINQLVPEKILEIFQIYITKKGSRASEDIHKILNDCFPAFEKKLTFEQLKFIHDLYLSLINKIESQESRVLLNIDLQFLLFASYYLGHTLENFSDDRLKQLIDDDMLIQIVKLPPIISPSLKLTVNKIQEKLTKLNLVDHSIVREFIKEKNSKN